jgi:prefoldin subunit 5
MKVRLALGSLVAGLVLVAACGDDDSTADDVQQLCADMSAVQATVDEITGAQFDPATTTKEDVQSALGTLRSEVEAVQSDAVDVADSVKSSLQDAFDSFESAIEDIPNEADTLEEAGAAVQSAAADFATAWDDTMSELSCSTTTTSTTTG